jgi:disulfide bond formation protein DsbB
VSYLAVTRSLSTMSLIAGVAGLVLLLLFLFPSTRDRLTREVVGEGRLLLGAAWVVATVASLGSLYFSDVVGFIPCALCWYQRIAMYPLVVILGVAAVRSDEVAWRYALPLSTIGLAIAAYHAFIQYRPALAPTVCDAAAPCTARYVAVFGFISIPVMAGFGFLLISALLLLVRASRA